MSPTSVASMQLNKFPFADTRAFNAFFIDYIEQKETLKPFYNRFPEVEHFQEQIKEKQNNFTTQTRSTLVQALRNQYKDVEISGKVNEHIDSLALEKTFTITTGHQLNICTGPLYFIYKIVTVINACKELKQAYPDFDFVPVYWMASEDHDYDEIKYFRLYDKKYTWTTNQSGAVGRFETTGLADLLNDVPGNTSLFREAYSKHKKLADAVRHYVNELFKDEGLLVLDGDDASLKALFVDVMRDDILNNTTKKIVDETNKGLEDLGYKPQIFCRDINFFFLEEGLRERLEKRNDEFAVLETTKVFNEQQLQRLIEDHPEKLSPNVILRPLYQEMILPNLAYVGGPAEVIYWLQLKDVFKHHNVTFPMLMPRNFAMIIDHEVNRKLLKTGLELGDIFEDKNYLHNHWVLRHSPRNLTVGSERMAINELFEKLRERAEGVDKSLAPFVSAEGKRALNSLEKIERKFLRAEKRLHADKLRQIDFVKDRLFPNGSLQERTDNFLNFYQQDADFISRLLNTFNAFDYRFNVITLA